MSSARALRPRERMRARLCKAGARDEAHGAGEDELGADELAFLMGVGDSAA